MREIMIKRFLFMAWIVTAFFLLFSTNLFAFQLTGTWKLISIQRKFNNQWKPDCASPTGLLIYTKDGYMAASINCMLPNNPKQPSFSEQDMTFYSGTYSYHGTHVVHHVRNANSPAYFGKNLTRKVEIMSANRISLWVENNKDQLIRLEWEKI